MARHYKRWEDHSPRWQRQAKREGLTPQRWNGWLKLSDKTRKETDPRKYAAGVSVAGQRVERKREAAVNAIRKAMGLRQRKSVIENNVNQMKESDLDWTNKATARQIRQRAAMKKVPGYTRNPWWAYGI